MPLVADMSSTILSRPIDVARFGVIYAGAQKNLGPSGVTLVVMDKALAERAPEGLPTMLDYRTHIKAASLYNTPPTFGIYMTKLATEWMLENGGLTGIESVNNEKAEKLYAAIDADGYYRCPVEGSSRSKMNVCFRLANEEQEAAFISSAKNEGMIGLKGHRSVGGMRASIYNAMPLEGVQHLIDFMADFKRQNG